ncbi:rieske [2Fe-2S] domain protein [Acetobacteraceae bacterium AT-5844]|nr:rieske [2Fe-2S] domain protein [Acetobacteraceae bacterium AT-5844]
MSLRPLCRLEDIPDGQAKGFSPAAGFAGLFAIRQGRQVFVYVNACPHIGVALDIMPDRFLNHRGNAIICALHGALFRIEDGFCTQGPCVGDSLEAVPAEVDAAGTVWVPEDAGL